MNEINKRCRGEIKGLVINDVFGFRQHIGKNVNHVLDIGANIGLFSMASFAYWPKSNINSFEPCKDTFECLRNNTDLFNRVGSIRCHNAGFGSDGYVSGSYDSSHHRLANIATPQEKKQLDSVPSYSLPHIFDKFSISGEYVIKMDCEGAEKYLLDNNKDYTLDIDWKKDKLTINAK